MSVMAAAPVSAHNTMPSYPALSIFSPTDCIYSSIRYVRIFFMPWAPAVSHLPNSAQVAVHSVLASRIFFNLRQCDKQIYSFGDVFSLQSMRYQARSTVGATTQAEVVHIA